MRLALTALHLAPWLKPDDFVVLDRTGGALFQKMATTARAIASDAKDVPDRIVALVQQQHPAINRWALDYAHNQAGDQQAHLILLGMLLAARDADERAVRRARPTLAKATQALFEQKPQEAPKLLKPILRNHGDNTPLAQGILLGLVRCRKAGAGRTLSGLPSVPNLDAQNLAVVVRARWGLPLKRSHRAMLRTIVRGGGALRPSLRIQAAWLYLKRTDQLNTALRNALNADK
jgi:hypothetical protein